MKLRGLLLALAFAPAALVAAERNDVSSCYAAAKIEEFRTPPSGRMLTVVVDQTTPLTQDLQRKAWGHIKRFVQPGDKLRLYSFSAYLDGHYTQLRFAGELERPLDPAVIGDVPMMSTRKLDNCLKGQPQQMFKRFGQAFSQAMGTSSSDIPRSEILFSLKEIAQDMHKAGGVDDNVVFILSDMLEYSDFGSFYVANGIRTIDPKVELAKVEKQNLMADFGGARVFVHGAAFVPTTAKNGYRSGKMIQNLQGFWSQYFEKSNAELRAFGNPELTATLE
ncbi:hypothetical protein NK553_24220 [Pseudomonas sp. ZM23]|uniref:VWA domain-containing protein n=1 Tax=Pseudomonas triclosanedens TaxID=2961893 RepID=A0ABY6ZUD2_9PSED|nr:hypothetical protein [Pseudomonas triclosanedens]MCP8467063.1 hypothetical protein [Pseudomonas triclosanedens]MCP8472788.1 hypothetical protein [Pseudomonas triclosanedens]MCP8478219.1 hypothetical protein [Pseudomonas triclosanedens]WAI47625.1 hypothetical protein OU419_17785 [Pseudomonas triclosanedens]